MCFAVIYPIDNKCVICKKRYYGCPYKNSKNMLSCLDFVAAVLPKKPLLDLALARCMFGSCPRRIFNKVENGIS